MDGGVFGLLGLIALHRGAVEYDLRHRFQIGLRDIGATITMFEVVRLVEILTNDPSSAIASALAGWDYPISREALALLDLYDLTMMANSDTKKGRPNPHPGRPYEVAGNRQRVGNTGGRTRAEIAAILNAHGHSVAA